MNPNRELLRDSDALLDTIEVTRLRNHPLSPELRGQLTRFAERCRFKHPVPKRPGGAHRWMLRLQGHLMGSRHNRAGQAFNRGSKRPKGKVRIIFVEHYQYVTLPRPYRPQDDEWRELAAAMVERNYQRWAYAHHHARKAVTTEQRESAAGQLDKAWREYYEIRCELEDILNEHIHEEAA